MTMSSEDDSDSHAVEHEEQDSEYCSSGCEENFIISLKLFLELQKKIVDVKKLESLLKKLKNIDIRDANNKNNTPLHAAVRRGHVGAVNLLLKYGAKVDIKNDEGQTPSVIAESLPVAKSNSKKEILDILDSIQKSNFQKNVAELSCDEYDGRTTENLPATPKEKKFVAREESEDKIVKKQCKNSNKFNEEGKTSLGVAVEKHNLEAIKSLLGLSFESSSGSCSIDTDTELLNETCDKNGNTPVILSAKLGHTDELLFILSLGAEVNETNKDGYRAVDYSWRKKDYKSVLALLKKDSYIPSECIVASIEGEDENAKSLKQFLCERDELHKLIKLGNLDKIKVLIRNDTSKVYLSPKNESAMYATRDENRWDIYAFFTSMGAKFKSKNEEQKFERSLTTRDKEDIRRELEEYIFEVENSHLIKLVGKSKVLGEISDANKIIEGFYAELDKSPNVSAIIRVLQYSRNLEVIFDFNSDTTKNMDIEDSWETKGKTDYVNNIITIAAKDSNVAGEKKVDVLGTLAHEMAHQAISILYSNNCKPYSKEDNDRAAKFNEITENILKTVHLNIAVNVITETQKYLTKIDDHLLRTAQSRIHGALTKVIKGIEKREDLLKKISSKIDLDFITRVVEGETTAHIDDVIKRVFTVYQPEHWHAELIVRIPHMLAKFGDEEGKKIIMNQAKELLEYFERHVIQACNDFLRNSSYMKHAITIMDMNEYLGEIQSIQSGKIRLEELSKNKLHQCYYKEKFWLVKASSIHLCSIYFYQTLLDEYKSRFQQCCLFIKLSYFEKNRNKVLNALKSKACEVMVLISDSFFPCDLDNLFSAFRSIVAKVILIINENHPFDWQVTDFTWNSLKRSSKEYLMEKKFQFQGKELSLKKMFDLNLNSELLNVSALAQLVGESKIIIGNENELDSKDFFDDYYIERQFRQQTIQHDIFKKETGLSVLFISNATKQELISLGAPDNHIQQWENGENTLEKGKRILFLADKNGKRDEKMFSQIYHKISKQRKIHWLHLQRNYLVWKNSNADLSELNEFINKDVTIEYKDKLELVNLEEFKNVIILADKSGMGKSTMLNKVAKMLKKLDFWVVRFNLIDYISDLKNVDFEANHIEKAIELVVSMLHFKTPLEKCIFKQCCSHSKKIVMMFDGVDEINPTYKRNLIHLLKALKQSSIAQIWISTRFHGKSLLEIELKVLAYTLNHWTREDQLTFLNNYWKSKLKYLEERNNEEILKKITDKLKGMQEGIKQWMKSVACESDGLIKSVSGMILKLDNSAELSEKQHVKVEQLQKNIDELDFSHYADTLLEQLNKTIHDEEGKFTYVPLHIKMLADVVFVYSFKIPKHFNLNELYDFFVNAKFDIYFEKKKLENANVEDIRNLCEDPIHKAYQYEAMKVFLNDEKSFPKESFQQHSKNVNEPMIQVGLVTPYRDTFKFIHRTFAEYFFSEGLIENAGNAHVQRVWLEKILVDKDFAVVRHFLNSRIEKKNLCIEFDSDLIEEKMFFKANKKTGTNLQRLASEGLESIMELFFENFPKKVCEIIWHIDGVGENILHCACQNRNTKVIDNILSFANNELKKDLIERMITQRDRSGRTPFYVAVENNYTESMKVFFQRKYQSVTDKTRKEMFFKTKKKGKTVLHESVFRGYESAVELLFKLSKDVLTDDRCKKFLMKCDSNDENVFHYAASKTNINILHCLWKFSKDIKLDENLRKDFITKPDAVGETVLHKITFRGNVDVLKCILAFSLEVCSDDSFEEFLMGSDNTEETVLHKAASRSHGDLLHYFLNRCNEVIEKLTLMKFMLKGNTSGSTVLHKAAQSGSLDVLKKLLAFVIDLKIEGFFKDFIFKQDKSGNSILHVAAYEGHFDFVKEVLCMIKSLLHEEALQEFLQMPNKEGHTIIHESIFKGHVEIFNLLYQHAKSTLNKQSIQQFLFLSNDSHGSTLHYATLKGNVALLKQLWDMFKRESTNEFFIKFVEVTNDAGDTILHIAAFKGYHWIIKDLFEMAGNILSKESLSYFLNKTNGCDETFFHRAILKANTNIVSELHSFDKDVLGEETIKLLLCQADKGKDTVLHKVAKRCYTSLMNALLVYAKDVLSKDSLKEFITKPNIFGYTILHEAVLKDNINFIDVFKNFYECNVFEEFYFHDFLLKIDKDWEDTVLHKAAFKGKSEVLNKLLEFACYVLSESSLKIFILKSNIRGYTALHKAAVYGTCDFFSEICERFNSLLDDKSFVELLIKPNKYGNTILHTAASRGVHGITKKVCGYLNDQIPKEFILQTDKDGDTIFHKASIKGNTEVFVYLVEFVKTKLNEKELTTLMYSKNIHGNNFMQLASKSEDPDFILMMKEFEKSLNSNLLL